VVRIRERSIEFVAEILFDEPVGLIRHDDGWLLSLEVRLNILEFLNGRDDELALFSLKSPLKMGYTLARVNCSKFPRLLSVCAI
jgi:hypothetical protein